MRVRSNEEVFKEIWPDIAPLIDAALRGEATYRENLPLVVSGATFTVELPLQPGE